MSIVGQNFYCNCYTIEKGPSFLNIKLITNDLIAKVFRSFINCHYIVILYRNTIKVCSLLVRC